MLGNKVYFPLQGASPNNRNRCRPGMIHRHTLSSCSEVSSQFEHEPGSDLSFKPVDIGKDAGRVVFADKLAPNGQVR